MAGGGAAHRRCRPWLLAVLFVSSFGLSLYAHLPPAPPAPPPPPPPPPAPPAPPPVSPLEAAVMEEERLWKAQAKAESREAKERARQKMERKQAARENMLERLDRLAREAVAAPQAVEADGGRAGGGPACAGWRASLGWCEPPRREGDGAPPLAPRELRTVQGFGAADGAVTRRNGSETDATQALVKPSASRKQSHAANLLLLPNGDLLLAFFAGEEGASGCAIFLSRLRRDRAGAPLKWDAPRLVSKSVGWSAQNPVLALLPRPNVGNVQRDPSLLLMHTRQRAERGQSTAEVVSMLSTDFGDTFTPPRLLFRERGAMIRNAMLPPDGNDEWLLPMYYTPQGQGFVDDQWSNLKRSTRPDSSWPAANASRLSSHGSGLVQPTVIRLPYAYQPGRPKVLRAYFRDRRAAKVYTSISLNGGRGWNRPEWTGLPNNNKAVFAAALPSGRVAIVFNDMAGQNRGRRLTVALSEDGGKTFHARWDVQDGRYAGAEFSYPTLVADPHRACDGSTLGFDGGVKDSALHLAYTFSKPGVRRYGIRYVCVRESFVRARGGPV